MNLPIKIAITGGTGHLGNVLINDLLSRDFSVFALYRSSLPVLAHPNLVWLHGDITSQNAIESLVQRADIVIHSAAVISIGNQHKDEVYDININGTKNILNACERYKSRLIYISSSTAVQETSGNLIFNENRPYKKHTDFIYEYTKALSEQLILEAVRNRDLDAIIIRPTSIIGPPDHKPSYFGEAILNLSKHTFPVIVSGGYNLVDVRDVSQTVINSIFKGISGEIYLTGGTYLTLLQIAQIANPERKYMVLSVNLLVWLLPLINVYQKIFPMKWPLTRESIIILKRAPKIVDSSKAINQLNHQIRPVSDTIKDLLEWFKSAKV